MRRRSWLTRGLSGLHIVLIVLVAAAHTYAQTQTQTQTQAQPPTAQSRSAAWLARRQAQQARAAQRREMLRQQQANAQLRQTVQAQRVQSADAQAAPTVLGMNVGNDTSSGFVFQVINDAMLSSYAGCMCPAQAISAPPPSVYTRYMQLYAPIAHMLAGMLEGTAFADDCNSQPGNSSHN